MSLDLDGKMGVTTAGTFAAGLTSAALTDAQIAAGNMSEDSTVKVFIDTSGGDVDVNAAAITAIGALTGIAEGDKFAFVKATADNGKITFTDGDGIVWNFVNRQSEFICLTWDGSTLQVAM